MSYFQVITTCQPPVLITRHLNYRLSASEGDNKSEASSVPVVSRWLWPGNKIFLEVYSMVITWWIMAFLHSVRLAVSIFIYLRDVLIGLSIFYSSQDMIKDRAEQKLCLALSMFSFTALPMYWFCALTMAVMYVLYVVDMMWTHPNPD